MLQQEPEEHRRSLIMTIKKIIMKKKIIRIHNIISVFNLNILYTCIIIKKVYYL